MVAAIIGGTGVYALKDLKLKPETVKSPFGDVTVDRNDDLIFLNRHAPNHSVPPHKINYRANIKALEMMGVKRIYGAFAVGSINPDFELGVPIILDDFIDFSSGRAHTFFDEIKQAVGHLEMSVPFCPVLSYALQTEAEKIDLRVRQGGTYASVNGPRFETPAEIRAYRQLGCDVVGMTLCPELPLARELGMSYAALAFSINWGAGMKPNIEFLDGNVEETKAAMMRVMIAALEVTSDDQCTPAKIL
ncbi:MAG: S-methyl-5'-thioadenosine phosphorylase [Acidimicrobiales bacterium]|nr:MAG: S-methyl-5'-thioadenosine phosphorylase [Acidimicrobiales bacterium]